MGFYNYLGKLFMDCNFLKIQINRLFVKKHFYTTAFVPNVIKKYGENRILFELLIKNRADLTVPKFVFFIKYLFPTT